MTNDTTTRFFFEQADIRGEYVCLQQTLNDVLSNGDYPAAIAALLGEFLAASVLVSGNLKFEGRLLIQAQSEQGAVPLIVAESTHDYKVRGVARVDGEIHAERFDELFPAGRMAITIEPKGGERYQGVVPLEGENLAACLKDYFEQSEQLDTAFWFACDGQRVAGMLLQALPADRELDPDQRRDNWEHVLQLATTLKAEEMLTLDTEQVLYRLFHQDEVRVMESESVQFSCTCSRERTERTLLSLGQAELDSILEEQTDIKVDCQFCNQQYRFTRQDISALFAEPSSNNLH